MAALLTCGDIVNYQRKDGMLCSAELADIVSSADLSICNFEAPIEGYGSPQPKSGIHHFQREATINGLKKQGFDLLLLANNHIMDFGQEGLAATIEAAKKVGMETLGAGMNPDSAYKPMIKELGDVTIGMINACEAQFGVIDYFKRKSAAGYAWINHPRIDELLSRLKQKCDFVVLFAHAGLEHYNIPQKVWRERYRHFCRSGASVVIGSHPHVPQGYEKYRDSLIFYSLGNFYFDSKNYKDKEDCSFAVWLDLIRGKLPEFKPVFHYKKSGLIHSAPNHKKVDIEKICALLEDGYEKAHDQMCLEAFTQFRRNLVYSLMPIHYDGNLKSSVRGIVSRILGRRNKVDKTLLQLHLLRNETLHFVAKHAMEIIAEDRFCES